MDALHAGERVTTLPFASVPIGKPDMTEASVESADNAEPIIAHTANIVSAFVQNNTVSMLEVSNLIKNVHSTLRGLGRAGASEPRNELKPAVSLRRSITPEFLICLEDGKKLKMLKRYLRSRYGLSPDEYRLKWNLPADYPMAAPNYSARRSDLAKRNGLGRSRATSRKRRSG
jgi:predicted transcriptional regulator